ncbi:MAG: pilus assembly protein TadG-related protein [Thermodesulfobacteriota bacterium]|nr:pilus assembly protein TadG-related protein [Thermodesulfobacteriota bacterium]
MLKRPNILPRKRQSGQAAVFVLVLLGVVLVCTVFLYKSGRITSEKMQLQNAADAAAYSAMTLEARSLNFAAYTNRAMVGNEVGIGQMVGLLSWADQLTTTEEGANLCVPLIEAAGAALAAALAPTIGGSFLVEAATQIIVTTIETMAGVLTAVGVAMEAFLDVVAEPVIKGLSLVNKVYSTSQMVYHAATYGEVVKSLYQNLEDNTEGTSFKRSDILNNDQGGAHLSDLGIIALVGHVPSFWSGYTKTYSSPTSAAKRKKKDAANKAGMGRMAATVREGRDPFTSGDKGENTNRDWALELDLKMYVTINLLLFDITLGAEYVLGAEGCGASELRYTDGFAWSAADTTMLVSKLKIFGKWYPFPGELPFGWGASQAPESLEATLLPQNILPSVPEKIYGHRNPEVYGGAGSKPHLSAWPFAILEMEKNIVPAKNYMGLQPYRDMASMQAPKPGGSKVPFQAPYFMVGVIRTLKDIDTSGPQFGGQLNLTNYASDTNVDRLGAIARAELYFMRPEHPDYFARKNRKVEKPNVFSPFWQARLVDTTDLQRFTALALQQRVLWLTQDEKKFIGGGVLDDILKIVDEVLEGLADIVDRVLRLFL